MVRESQKPVQLQAACLQTCPETSGVGDTAESGYTAVLQLFFLNRLSFGIEKSFGVRGE